MDKGEKSRQREPIHQPAVQQAPSSGADSSGAALPTWIAVETAAGRRGWGGGLTVHGERASQVKS